MVWVLRNLWVKINTGLREEKALLRGNADFKSGTLGAICLHPESEHRNLHYSFTPLVSPKSESSCSPTSTRHCYTQTLQSLVFHESSRRCCQWPQDAPTNSVHRHICHSTRNLSQSPPGWPPFTIADQMPLYEPMGSPHD